MFPFWIATKPDGQPVVFAPQTKFVVAFTTVGGAREFLRGMGESEWEFKLVGRASLGQLATQWRKWGLLGVCLDPGSKRKSKVTWDEIEGTL